MIHSRYENIHSIHSLMIKIIKRAENVSFVDNVRLYFISGKIGIIRIISISKIKNIRVIIKNWIENGRRGLVIGLNPHSNGVIFFRFLWISLVNRIFSIIMIIGIIMNTMFMIISWMIIYILLKFSNWKLDVIKFILYI